MVARWSRRLVVVTFLFLAVIGLLYRQSKPYDKLYSSWGGLPPQHQQQQPNGGVDDAPKPAVISDGKFTWAKLKLHHPIPEEEMRPVPTPDKATLEALPRIQHDFRFDTPETAEQRAVRLARLSAVRSNFTHAWTGYQTHAWMADELRPIAGTPVSKFGGWAATLVDSLDTLWIMGMKADFHTAATAVGQIDFTVTNQEEVNVFETTIRFLGGLLGAFDISGGTYPDLLRKATEVGDMLYVAFDTPNHMPVTRWRMTEARWGREQKPHKTSLVSELGSLSLEFTRLSQLTGNPKYFDAVQRVMDAFAAQQDKTYLPGLWPVIVNAADADFTGSSGFTIGGMADSLYEYLPKQYFLLGGAMDVYRDMYLKSLAAMETDIFFRPRTASPRPLLFPGDKTVSGAGAHRDAKASPIVPRVQHLGCFAGGMVGLAARLFQRPGDLETAQQLVEGCLWAYESGAAGIMPEIMYTSVCPDGDRQTDSDPDARGAHAPVCAWSEADWHRDVAARARPAAAAAGDPTAGLDVAALAAGLHLAPGVTKYEDRRYILRPEAIESVFLLYRLTGDRSLQDRAWAMFEAIVSASKTELAHTALNDCTTPDTHASWADSMESFWLAETLKYFYLIFADPGEVSLDEFVLNTEAHPFRRPK